MVLVTHSNKGNFRNDLCLIDVTVSITGPSDPSGPGCDSNEEIFHTSYKTRNGTSTSSSILMPISERFIVLGGKDLSRQGTQSTGKNKVIDLLEN